MSTDSFSSHLIQDLDTLRKQCVDGLLAGDNRFELILIPFAGMTPESLPVGFADAVRKQVGSPLRKPVIPDYLYLLPYFSSSRARARSGLAPKGFFVGSLKVEQPKVFRLDRLGDGHHKPFVVVLRTDSRPNAKAKLLPGEKQYLRFMKAAGALLEQHKVVVGPDDRHAWIGFLVDYVWTHRPPKIFGGCGIVGDLWKRSLAAVDGLIRQVAERGGNKASSKVARSDSANKSVRQLVAVEPKSVPGLSERWPMLTPQTMAILEYLWEHQGQDVDFRKIRLVPNAVRSPNTTDDSVEKAIRRIVEATGLSICVSRKQGRSSARLSRSSLNE